MPWLNLAFPLVTPALISAPFSLTIVPPPAATPSGPFGKPSVPLPFASCARTDPLFVRLRTPSTSMPSPSPFTETPSQVPSIVAPELLTTVATTVFATPSMLMPEPFTPEIVLPELFVTEMANVPGTVTPPATPARPLIVPELVTCTPVFVWAATPSLPDALPPAGTTGVALIRPLLVTTPLTPGRTASLPVEAMTPAAELVIEFVRDVRFPKFTALLPLLPVMVPEFVNAMLISCTVLEPIAIVSSPVAEMPPVFWMLRTDVETVDRTARPVLVCVIVPSFCSVTGVTAVPPDIVTATVPPLTERLPVPLTVPVRLESVCATFTVLVIGFGPGLNWARTVEADNPTSAMRTAENEEEVFPSI